MKRKKWNYRLYKAEKVRQDENEVMNVKEKFMRFMQGRYGVYGPDLLNRFLMGMAMALMILSLFVRRMWFIGRHSLCWHMPISGCFPKIIPNGMRRTRLL